MYRIVYTKQAVKDIKNLKSVHLDEKAKKLIEVIKENPNALKRSSNVIELTAEMEQCIGKPDKALEGDEHMVGELINTFLKTLDTDKRNIFIKRYWYSQPVKVISKELGKSESSVKVALHRLRKDLKKLLESEGVLV